MSKSTDKDLVMNDCWNRIGVFGDKSCPELPRHVRCLNCEVFRDAGALLLNRKVPGGYREFWTERISHPHVDKRTGTSSIVVFRLGSEWLALPAAVFLEVAELRPIHSLPHREDALLRGLTVVRGELLICISLVHLLGIDSGGHEPGPKQERGAYERLLVVGSKGERVVFAADEVHAGVRYHPGDLKPVPSTVSLSARPYTTGLLQWREHNVGILDESLIFYTLSRQLA